MTCEPTSLTSCREGDVPPCSRPRGRETDVARIEHEARPQTLIGMREGDTVQFDIHLQGKRETVFFDI